MNKKITVIIVAISIIVLGTMVIIAKSDKKDDNLCNHNYLSTVTKENTCVEFGIKTYTCQLCGDSYTEEIAKTNSHSYTSKTTKSATCKDKGIKTYTCQLCGDSYTEEIAKTNSHIWLDATCVSGKKCSLCATTVGSANKYNHYGDNQCSLCNINYYEVLGEYIYLYGTKKTSSGINYWTYYYYGFYDSNVDRMYFSYEEDKIFCGIEYKETMVSITLTKDSKIYDYQYFNSYDYTFISGKITASQITKNTTFLSYDSISNENDKDYLTKKASAYVKLILTGINEFSEDKELYITVNNLGFINY